MTRQAFAWTVVPLGVVVVLIVDLWHTPWTPSKIAGLILAVIGFGMVALARYQLGISFSITPQARRLVTGGIYSVVRHPVYVFGMIGAAGVILYLQRPALLLWLLPVIAIQVVRARAEERVLIERFGDEYREYRARTWL